MGVTGQGVEGVCRSKGSGNGVTSSELKQNQLRPHYVSDDYREGLFGRAALEVETDILL